MHNRSRKKVDLNQRRGVITKSVTIPAMIVDGYVSEDDLGMALTPYIEKKLGRPLAPDAEVHVEVVTGDYLDAFEGLRFEVREPISATDDQGDDVG